MDAAPSSLTFSQAAGKFIRRLALVAVLGATALAAAYFCALHYAGEVVRSQVESQLQEHYGALGLDVSIEEARFIKDRGIVLSNLTMREKSGRRAGQLVCAIDEVRVAAPMCLHDLVDPPPADQITLSGARYFSTINENYEFSIARIMSAPAFGDEARMTPVRLQNASFTLLNENGEAAFVLDKVNTIIQAEKSQPDSQLIDIRGSSTGDQVEKLEFIANYDPRSEGWSIQARLSELAISPAAMKKLPQPLAEKLKPASGVKGKIDATITAARNGAETNFEFRGTLSDARVDDERLPYPLTELSAEIFVNNQGVQISNLQSRNGLGWLNLNCMQQGLSGEGPLQISGFARQLVLDRQLRDSLPPEMQQRWDELDPQGTVNLEFTLAYDGQKWVPNATVNLLDVSFAHKAFPYRLTNCTGAVYHRGDLATVNLQAQAQQQTVLIEGAFNNPGPLHTGGITLRTSGPIQIDEALKQAMPTEGRDVIDQLQLNGAVSIWLEYRRDQPRPDAAVSHAVVTLQDCAIEFDQFKYPIKKISGTLEITDDVWFLRDLRGQNGAASIVCNGDWRSDDLGGKLNLTFDASDVPLNEDLRIALSPEVRQLWNAAGPRGDIDNLNVQLSYLWPEDETSLEIRATKWNRPQSTARAISLQAANFPYRLEDLTGSVVYKNGRLTFERILARHGDARFSAAGWVESTADRPWRCALTKLNVDRLKIDRGLLSAVPRNVASQFSTIEIEGPVGVSGQMFLSGGDDANSSRASWDLTFDLENGAVEATQRVEHIHGGVRLTGSADRNQMICRGELSVDSAFVAGLQVTNLRGPIWTDGREIFAGSWSPPVNSGQAARRVSADTMGGKLLVDAKMKLQDQNPFVLQASFTDGDLNELTRQTGNGSGVSGDAYANLELRGAAAGVHTLQGKGSVRLRDARVGELPVMVGLLKLLRVKEPNQTAFDNGDIDFTIEGDNIYFDRLDLKGDAITLRGIGEMNFDRQLNVYFYSVVGRDNVRLPLVTPALWVASRQLLLIKVDGSLEDPRVENEVFPGVNELLQQVFPESGDSTELPRPNDFLSSRQTNRVR